MRLFQAGPGFSGQDEGYIQSGDQARRYRGCVPDADGKQNIGPAYLNGAKGGHGGKNRQGEIAFPKTQRGEENTRCQHSDEAGRDGVCVFPCVHHENPGIADPGKNGSDISRQVSGLYTVHEEQHHAGKNRAAGNEIRTAGLLAVKNSHQQNDKHRRGKLEHNGVGGCGQLVRERKKGGDSHHGQRADQHSSADYDFPAGQQEINPEDRGADQVARAVDSQRRPGDQLDEQTSCAEAHRGQENKQCRPRLEPSCHQKHLPGKWISIPVRKTGRNIRTRIS